MKDALRRKALAWIEEEGRYHPELLDEIQAACQRVSIHQGPARDVYLAVTAPLLLAGLCYWAGWPYAANLGQALAIGVLLGGFGSLLAAFILSRGQP